MAPTIFIRATQISMVLSNIDRTSKTPNDDYIESLIKEYKEYSVRDRAVINDAVRIQSLPQTFHRSNLVLIDSLKIKFAKNLLAKFQTIDALKNFALVGVTLVGLNMVRNYFTKPNNVA